MIDETSGVTTLINKQRIQRENQPSSERKVVEQRREAREQNFTDVTSFSREALALARKIHPVSGNNEQVQIEQQDQGRETMQDSSAGYLDIRV